MTITTLEKWEEKTLVELCNIEIGKTPSRSNIKFWDKTRSTNNTWLSIADLNNTQNKKVFSSKEQISDLATQYMKLVKEGTLLLSFKLTIGRVAFAGKDLYTNEAIAQLPIKNEQKIDKHYLYYYLQYFDYEELLKGDVKVKGKTLNKEKLKGLPVCYPPLPEQERIVAKLDEAFEAIDKVKANAEQNLSNARELFEIYLEKTFTNSIAHYEIKSLSDIAAIKGGKRLPKGKSLIKTKTNHPYLRVTDFSNNGTIDVSDLHYISEDIYNIIKNYTITSEDLYITIVGATIGKSGIIPKELDGANLTENACKLIFKGNISNKYVYYFTKTKSFNEQSLGNIKIAAVPKLALTRLATIKLPIPDIEKQKQIVDKLDKFQEQTKQLEAIYTQKIKECDELKQSILQKAFRGEL